MKPSLCVYNLGQMRTHATDIQFTLDDHWYQWDGGFGAILKSYERNVRKGDVRMICGIPFHVANVWSMGGFRKPEVCWSIPDPWLTAEWIREFKRRIFE